MKDLLEFTNIETFKKIWFLKKFSHCKGSWYCKISRQNHPGNTILFEDLFSERS